MQNSTSNESRSPPQPGGVITRAQTGPQNNTAQPSLSSGFGAVIAEEYALHHAIEGSLGHITGHHSTEIERILRHHHSRLSANIALLEQRYEAPPNAERSVIWHDQSRPPTSPRPAPRDLAEFLPDLIAQHMKLLSQIEALIGCAPDGQRGELTLREVSRNHEEMASMLTALLKEDATAARGADEDRERASSGTRKAQENWDNEGGPVRTNPSAS